MTLDERISRYLAKCPPAISGSNGSGAAFRVACALVNGFALGPDAAMRWMLIYNAGCKPPWKPRDLRHKIDDAIKKTHDKPRGYLLGQEGNRGCLSGGARRACAPRPVPMRPKAPRGDLRTPRTFPGNLRANAGTYTRTDTVQDGALQASEASVAASRQAKPLLSEPVPPPLVPVPGCKVGRPPEIEMDDANWYLLEQSGLAGEPIVQLAVWMFGPNCHVIDVSDGRTEDRGTSGYP